MSACTGETMAIVYRRIETIDEYRAVEDLQAQVWGSDARDVVPLHLLLTANKRAIRKPDLWYHDSDHAVLIRSNLVCHDVHFDPIQRIMRPI